MTKPLALIFIIAALFTSVGALPVTFSSHFLREGHAGFSVFHHVSHVEGSGKEAKKLRFLFLVPKMTTYLKEGFASEDSSSSKNPVHHKFLNVDHDTGEKLVHLVGLSDCSTWHAVFLKVYSPQMGLLFKGFTAVKENGAFKLKYPDAPVLPALADFVHRHTTAERLAALLGKGLAAHHLTHLLHQKVADLFP